MSGTTGAKAPWPTNVLVTLGFDEHDAQRLRRVLPPVSAEVIAEPGWTEPLLRWYPDGPDPVAAVLWKTYNLSTRGAALLADSERDVSDVIVILDSVASHIVEPTHLSNNWWSRDQVRDARYWLTAREMPAHRASLYIDAGVTLGEAIRFERDPDNIPSDAQLGLLAGLRAPAPTP